MCVSSVRGGINPEIHCCHWIGPLFLLFCPIANTRGSLEPESTQSDTMDTLYCLDEINCGHMILYMKKTWNKDYLSCYLLIVCALIFSFLKNTTLDSCKLPELNKLFHHLPVDGNNISFLKEEAFSVQKPPLHTRRPWKRCTEGRKIIQM